LSADYDSKTGSSRYHFGVNGTNVGGWGEGSVFNPHVTWEESLKLNVGRTIKLDKTQQLVSNRSLYKGLF